MSEVRKPKTWKRELAFIAFAVWALLTWLHFTATDAALVTAQSPSYNGASFALWTFIGAMFGIHHLWPGGK